MRDCRGAFPSFKIASLCRETTVTESEADDNQRQMFAAYEVTSVMTNAEKQKTGKAADNCRARMLWVRFSGIAPVTRASSIAFFTFLSLVPMLAIAISLVSMMGVSEQDILAFFTASVPDEISDTIGLFIGDAFKRSGVAFSISTLVLLWSASKGAKALCRGLNAAYEQRETRNAVVVTLTSIAVGLALAVLLAAVICLMFSGVIAHLLDSAFPGISDKETAVRVSSAVIMAVVLVAMFAACYKFLPAGKRRFFAQLPGATIAMVAIGLLSLGFRVYVKHFADVTILYGTIATVGLLLLWIYLAAFILIAGGFVNKLLEGRRREETSASPGAASDEGTAGFR